MSDICLNNAYSGVGIYLHSVELIATAFNNKKKSQKKENKLLHQADIF